MRQLCAVARPRDQRRALRPDGGHRPDRALHLPALLSEGCGRDRHHEAGVRLRERVPDAALTVDRAAVTAERDRILNQLERAFEGEAWHGPSVLEALEGVSWKEAHQKAIPTAHSIW